MYKEKRLKIKKMNEIKIQSVLRSRTLEMFSNEWYYITSKLIYEQFLEKKEIEIDNEIQEIYVWFTKNLVYDKIYDSKKVYKNLNKNISQKKMTMLLNKFCEKEGLIYNLIRTHNKRNFVLKLK